MTPTLTTLTPAIILLIIYLGVKLFPPSLGNAFISGGPSWWSRDQKTWDKAYTFLAGKYLRYNIVLAVFCSALLIFEWVYASYLGYIALLILLGLTHYQVRTHMDKNVK